MGKKEQSTQNFMTSVLNLIYRSFRAALYHIRNGYGVLDPDNYQLREFISVCDKPSRLLLPTEIARYDLPEIAPYGAASLRYCRLDRRILRVTLISRK